MSTYSEKQLEYDLGIPLITTSEEFQNCWRIYRFLRAQRLLTPEIREFCNKEVIEKIRQEDNEYLSTILHQSLLSIISYLNEKGKKFLLGVYLYKDSDVLEWEEFTILINVKYRDFDEKMSLWKNIENGITRICERLKRENPKDSREIERANEIIATSVQELIE